MAINLAKTATKKRLTTAKSSTELKRADLVEATKQIDELTSKLDEPCEPEREQPKKPKKQRKPRGTGKKKVQIRPPRKYKPRDLKRIAKKVIDEQGKCPSTMMLISAAVLSETGAEHWLDIIIRMLGNIHDIYIILLDATDYRDIVSYINDARTSIQYLSDIVDTIADFAIYLLSIPRSLVTLLEPIDNFIVALRNFLIKYRALIVSFL